MTKLLLSLLAFTSAVLGVPLSKRAAPITKNIKLWGSGKIPYDPSFPPDIKDTVAAAIADWNSKSLCVQFTELAGEPDFISFSFNQNSMYVISCSASHEHQLIFSFQI